MASVSWTNKAGGDWNVGTNWAGGTVPAVADDVIIDAGPVATTYLVTIAAGVTDTVTSLTMNDVNNRSGANDPAGYRAAELALNGTLAFAPGSAGRLGGSLQTYIDVGFGQTAAIVNGGMVDGFIQVEGNLTFTGSNPLYITNDLQADGGIVTINTGSIGEITGSTMFDGIYDASSSVGATINLGGSAGLIVNIATIQGPALVPPPAWTELTFNGPNTAINEWNGTAYVSVETSLQDIEGGGTVDVLNGRNYTTAQTLTIEGKGTSTLSGLLNLQAGTVTAAAININGGVVQGSAAITSGVVNNGTLIASHGTMSIGGALTGTGTVKFDFDDKTATVVPGGATLSVGSVSAGQHVIMNGTDTLVLQTPGSFAGTIAAGIGDKIVLAGLTATSAVDTNGTLVVMNGAQTVASLALSGSYTGDVFNVSGSTITVASSTPSPTPTPTPAHFGIVDTTTGATLPDTGTAYSGPVAGLQWQFITATTDSLAITATAPNSFIHTGSGNDAIDVSKVNGTNVLDGSTGSNFLVGGTGFDTFFLDDRSAPADIFSTVVNFHSGDNATVFGVTATDFTLTTSNNQGAVGYKGLDFAFTAAGKANANLVLTGYTTADLTNGKLSVSYGTTAATGGVAGSTFMLIHAN